MKKTDKIKGFAYLIQWYLRCDSQLTSNESWGEWVTLSEFEELDSMEDFCLSVTSFETSIEKLACYWNMNKSVERKKIFV